MVDAPGLLPCPFCGAELERDEDGAQHPGDDCVLSQVYIFDTNLHEWNRRTDLSSPLAAVAMRDAAADRLDAIADGMAKDYTITPDYAAFRNAADYVRAIPLPDDAALLRAALAVPEVKRLVESLIQLRPMAQRLADTQIPNPGQDETSYAAGFNDATTIFAGTGDHALKIIDAALKGAAE